MVDNPLLTIIVPVYNQEELLLRALDSVPIRDDIEVLIINDGSTDRTLEIAEEYQSKHDNVRIITNPTNIGLGASKNVGYDNAKGQYINQLDSDDYFLTDKYNKVIDLLDGTDMVYINIQINNGNIWSCNKNTVHLWCGGPLRFIRREFLGNHRCPEVRAGEDWFLNEELQKIPHTDKFTNICAYHYNFPREGSLCDQRSKGELK